MVLRRIGGRGHFRSRDKDAVAENPLLYANFMALSSIEPELMPTEVLNCGNMEFRDSLQLRKEEKTTGGGVKIDTDGDSFMHMQNRAPLMWGEVSDVITLSSLMSIGSGVFDLSGSKNRVVTLTRRVALRTVLHYRADYDNKKRICTVSG